jgi:cytochrome c551/c552
MSLPISTFSYTALIPGTPSREPVRNAKEVQSETVCLDAGWAALVTACTGGYAQRYRRDPQQRDRLPYIIRGGSAGHWGERFVMWPQPRLSDQEIKQLVDWVLSQ